MWSFFRRRRHRALMETPFPDAWRALVEAHVPEVRTLSSDERARLEGLVQVFLAEKRFEGAEGLTVTDAMRLSVAAQACLLLLGDPDSDVYPDLATVILYPAAYRARVRSADGLFVTERAQVRLGESWDRGVVVLAWSAVEEGARNTHDGHNVVFHEFAHQLDQAHGAADGAPALPTGMSYAAWAATLGPEFAHLEAVAEAGRVSLLDAYGATNPAEFFAVATETFFEKPAQMRAKKPALYAQLASFYRQDPAARLDALAAHTDSAGAAGSAGPRRRAPRKKGPARRSCRLRSRA